MVLCFFFLLVTIYSDIFNFFFYKFIHFNWRLITLQYYSDFATHCHEFLLTFYMLQLKISTLIIFYVSMHVRSLQSRLSVTLWTVVFQASLSMGFSRQNCWRRLPCPPPEDLPDLGIQSTSHISPDWQVCSLPLALPGKPNNSL